MRSTLPTAAAPHHTAPSDTPQLHRDVKISDVSLRLSPEIAALVKQMMSASQEIWTPLGRDGQGGPRQQAIGEQPASVDWAAARAMVDKADQILSGLNYDCLEEADTILNLSHLLGSLTSRVKVTLGNISLWDDVGDDEEILGLKSGTSVDCRFWCKNVDDEDDVRRHIASLVKHGVLRRSLLFSRNDVKKLLLELGLPEGQLATLDDMSQALTTPTTATTATTTTTSGSSSTSDTTSRDTTEGGRQSSRSSRESTRQCQLRSCTWKVTAGAPLTISLGSTGRDRVSELRDAVGIQHTVFLDVDDSRDGTEGALWLYIVQNGHSGPRCAIIVPHDDFYDANETIDLEKLGEKTGDHRVISCYSDSEGYVVIRARINVDKL